MVVDSFMSVINDAQNHTGRFILAGIWAGLGRSHLSKLFQMMFLISSLPAPTRDFEVVGIWTVRKEHKAGCLKPPKLELNLLANANSVCSRTRTKSAKAGQAPAGNSSNNNNK